MKKIFTLAVGMLAAASAVAEAPLETMYYRIATTITSNDTRKNKCWGVSDEELTFGEYTGKFFQVQEPDNDNNHQWWKFLRKETTSDDGSIKVTYALINLEREYIDTHNMEQFRNFGTPGAWDNWGLVVNTLDDGGEIPERAFNLELNYGGDISGSFNYTNGIEEGDPWYCLGPTNWFANGAERNNISYGQKLYYMINCTPINANNAYQKGVLNLAYSGYFDNANRHTQDTDFFALVPQIRGDVEYSGVTLDTEGEYAGMVNLGGGTVNVTLTAPEGTILRYCFESLSELGTQSADYYQDATDDNGTATNTKNITIGQNGKLSFYATNGSSSTAPQSLTFGNDETSSISEIKAESNATTQIFDLQGRRVAKASKGLYIINGVKTIVK